MNTMAQRNDGYLTPLLFGAGLGAGLAYLLDPVSGNRRRRVMLDKTTSLGKRSMVFVNRAARDLAHRGQGLVAETRARLHSEEVADEVLKARVRSQLGRVVSHPSAVAVETRGGSVALTGDVLAHEVSRLLESVAMVRGVRNVQNHMRVSRTAGNIPSLQGGAHRTTRSALTPAARLTLGIVGGTLAAGSLIYGARAGVGVLAGMSGLAALFGRNAGTAEPLPYIVQKDEDAPTAIAL